MTQDAHTIAQPPGGTRLSFAAVMAFVIIALVAAGFSRTIEANLIHPPYPRPWIIYLHIAVFVSWLALFTTQALLIHAGKARWHRSVGRFGLVLGAAIPVVGVATAFAMTRMHVTHGEPEFATFLAIPLFDMICFTTAFALAALWRKRPEFHRRLMYVATCALTAAAWGRLPLLDQGMWFYAGVDALVLAGAIADRVATGRVHVVYRAALPALAAGQLTLAWLMGTPQWLALAPGLVR